MTDVTPFYDAYQDLYGNGLTGAVIEPVGRNGGSVYSDSGAASHITSVTTNNAGTVAWYWTADRYDIYVTHPKFQGGTRTLVRTVDALPSSVVSTTVADTASATERQVPRWKASTGKFAWRDPFFLTPEDFPDATDKVQAALDAAHTGTIKRVRITTASSYSCPSTGWTQYPGTTFDAGVATLAAPADLAAHMLTGYSPTADRSPATTYVLTANAALGAQTVTVSAANSANFAAGDMVFLKDPTYTSGAINIHREPNIVESVNTGTGVITLVYPLNSALTTANSCVIAPVTPVEDAHVIGGLWDMSAAPTTSIAPAGADTNAIYFAWAKDCTFKGIRATGVPYKTVSLYAAMDCVVESSCADPSAAGPGQGYNVNLEFCRGCVAGGYGRKVRHNVNMTGGSDCTADTSIAAGRTTSNQAAVFLGHGCHGRRHRAVNCIAVNMEQAIAIGNGSFDRDYDGYVDECVSIGCDEGVLMALGSNITGGTFYAYNNVVRAVSVNTSCDLDLAKLVIDGITTDPSGYAALDSSAAGKVTIGFLYVRNQFGRSVRVSGAGEVTIRDADVLQVAEQTALDASTASGKLRIGGKWRMETTTQHVCWTIGGTATLVKLDGEISANSSAAMSQGIYVSAAGADAVDISTCVDVEAHDGSHNSECVRVEASDRPVIRSPRLRPNTNGNCIRIGGSGISDVYVSKDIRYLGSFSAALADTQATVAKVHALGGAPSLGGFIAADRNDPWISPTTLLLVANTEYGIRFTVDRPTHAVKIRYSVSTAATNDDAVDVGVRDGDTLALLGSAGATTGKLNGSVATTADRIRELTVTSTVPLRPGKHYYAAISCGTVGGTAATLNSLNLALSSVASLLGASNPQVPGYSKGTSHPLPSSQSGIGATANVPILAILEA